MGRGKTGRWKRTMAPAVGLRVIRPNVAGIDVGSREHWVACPQREPGKPNVKRFGSVTDELERLVRWLEEEGIESVAMESTSVYWIPLYELLESRGIEVVLCNARSLNQAPGRKTDMLDCQWLQLLHACGLPRGSFRPGPGICRIRAVLRERGNLDREQGRVVQRMQKCLDQMNVQVHRAVSDLTGKTGMAIVRAIVDGERDPRRLAALRDSRCARSEAEIARCLTGCWREEHLFNLGIALSLFDHLQTLLDACDRQAMAFLQPLEARRDLPPLGPHPNPRKEKALQKRGEQPLRLALFRATGVDLTRIDGIGAEAARTIVAEVGPDLSRFPTESHFVSWLGLSPKSAISGGKPIPKKTRGTASTRAANTLRMAAVSVRNTDTALGASYRRVARRKDAKVAVFDTARKIARNVFRMLRHGVDYHDEGAAAHDARFHSRRVHYLSTLAKSMGYTLLPKTAPS